MRAPPQTALGARDLTSSEVESFRALIVDTGALEGVEADISHGAETARAALAEATGVAEPARRVLDELIELTTARST